MICCGPVLLDCGSVVWREIVVIAAHRLHIFCFIKKMNLLNNLIIVRRSSKFYLFNAPKRSHETLRRVRVLGNNVKFKITIGESLDWLNSWFILVSDYAWTILLSSILFLHCWMPHLEYIAFFSPYDDYYEQQMLPKSWFQMLLVTTRYFQDHAPESLAQSPCWHDDQTPNKVKLLR